MAWTTRKNLQNQIAILSHQIDSWQHSHSFRATDKIAALEYYEAQLAELNAKDPLLTRAGILSELAIIGKSIADSADLPEYNLVYFADGLKQFRQAYVDIANGNNVPSTLRRLRPAARECFAAKQLELLITAVVYGFGEQGDWVVYEDSIVPRLLVAEPEGDAACQVSN